MKTLFLDANVFFAATLSESGASRGIFDLGALGKVKLVSSLYVLNEAKRNIDKKLGNEYLPVFLGLVSVLNGVDKRWPSEKYVEDYGDLIVKKDLPVLVSAANLGVNFLITLDQKDFKTNKLQAADLPFKIMLPGEFLQSL